MKGEIIIDGKGDVTSSLLLGKNETDKIGELITDILQDISVYMRMNENAMGDLKRTTIRLG